MYKKLNPLYRGDSLDIHKAINKLPKPNSGDSHDIHKAINKLPKPNSGFTLPGHKYKGPSTQYNPVQGSSYVQLPSDLKNSTKGLINIKNKDNECFRWCQGKDPQRWEMIDNI